MGLRRSGDLILATGALLGACVLPALADDRSGEGVGPPRSVSVTVYRDPHRKSGSIDLDRLAGFALITELRTVHMRPGVNSLRFEGVADGIEPESALVTGIDGTILEKNRDAAVLSPAALLAAALGKPVVLTRRLPGTGRVERVSGTIASDAEGGVIFESSQGIEGLRCSGLPETLSFEGVEGLRAHPTLSVRVRALHEATADATLSYLARGFDWAANYTATLAADGRSMDLGAWVTLANGNGTGFPQAQAQVVAGVVNHATGETEPLDIGGTIIANCWPRGSTSDVPMQLQFDAREAKSARFEVMNALVAAPMSALAGSIGGALLVQQEQLGDLKLYRIPQPTTVASRQSKQVRLLDRAAIPVRIVYGIELAGEYEFSGTREDLPASRYLRTTNTEANHLGIPLPSGHVEVVATHEGRPLLERETSLRDLAVGEDVDIDLGASLDVTVTTSREGRVHRIDIANARPESIEFELKLRLPSASRIVEPTPGVRTKNGRPLFALTLNPNSSTVVRYRTASDISPRRDGPRGGSPGGSAP
jgi:hypothetical protein